MEPGLSRSGTSLASRPHPLLILGLSPDVSGSEAGDPCPTPASPEERMNLQPASRLLLASTLVAVLPISSAGQDVTVEQWSPRSTLVVPEHPTPRAKFPFVDVHSHHFRPPSPEDLDGLLAAMDAMNMGVMVNLSGGSGDRLVAMIAAMKEQAPRRFAVFANVDFGGIGEPGWSERAAGQLEMDVRNGAQGLKIFKSLGLSVVDSDSARVPVDDPRIDAVWAKAGELGIPVLIHSADPRQFWEPIDSTNEKWLELKLRPRRARADDDPAPWEQIIAEQHRVFKRHPGTTFINAHLGWFGNDLQHLGDLLDEMPNMYVGIGAVLYELGRQPRMAARFFERYQDRVLFGKDSWAPDEYPYYFRVLETEDDYFDYYRKYHALWQLYGIGLPDEALRKLYYENALRIIPGIDPSVFEGMD
jgi:predicted TIM-barrel fold metal-dependent hydrolase